MKRVQAFTFRLRQDGQQKRQMRCFAGDCRFIFNRARALQNENHAVGNQDISHTKMAFGRVAWKNAAKTPWFKDFSLQPQQSLKDLKWAYKNFFQKQSAFPRFKKREQNNAFCDLQGVKLDQENRLLQSQFVCWACGYTANADVNGARHILVAVRRAYLWKISSFIARGFVRVGVHRGCRLMVEGICKNRILPG